MNILITGNAGFIGSNLCDHIIENHPEHNIIGIDNLFGGYQDNINPIIKQYQLDISSENIDHIFKDNKIDILYINHSYATEGLSPFIREFIYKNNLISNAKLINASINYGIKKTVLISSMAVLGKGNPPFSENDIPLPVDPYGIAKYASELDIQVANKQHGLDYCIIRPHNVAGERQCIWDKYRNVLGIWMYEHLQGNPIVVFGDGLQKRAFSYIGDIVEPLYNAAILPESSKEIIHLGGKNPITILKAAEILIEIMGGGNIIHKEARHEVKDAYCTWNKSEKLLGYKEQYSFKEWLTKMWEWAKVQPDRPQFIWPKYEIDKGIYSYWRK